jgi:rubredoxin
MPNITDQLADALPELPRPAIYETYTIKQMRAYAREAIAAHDAAKAQPEASRASQQAPDLKATPEEYCDANGHDWDKYPDGWSCLTCGAYKSRREIIEEDRPW